MGQNDVIVSPVFFFCLIVSVGQETGLSSSESSNSWCSIQIRRDTMHRFDALLILINCLSPQNPENSVPAL